VVSEELKKFIYYRATQAIFKKYHSDLDPKLKDASVNFTAFAKFFAFKVTNEQEFSLTKTYEGPPFPSNEFAMALYAKVYGTSKAKNQNNAVTAVTSQSANMAKTENWCFHPLCRGKKKFASHTWDNCFRNRKSAHYKQQASNRKDATQRHTKFNSKSQSSKFHDGGHRKDKQTSNKNMHSNSMEDKQEIKGLTKNNRGIFASPSVRHSLSKVHNMSNSNKKALVSELQHALVVENIAAKFVATENHDDMIQGLCKLSSTSTSMELSPPAKKVKKQSINQEENTTNSAMIANNVNTSRPTKQQQNDVNPPQRCKHCGKCVIHTDGICDVYNVPSVHIASTELRDTQNMSVMFDSTIFDKTMNTCSLMILRWTSTYD
jgi:hypothetical protein